MEVTPSQPAANGAVAAAEPTPIVEPTSVRAWLEAAAADGSTS